MPIQKGTELARVAEQMLTGELELVEGCRKLVQLHRRSGSPNDDAIMTVIGIESETDDLPIGAEREQWAASALKEKDRQRDEYMAEVQASLTEALELLAGRR
jgi:hypothetical protein